MKKFISFLLVLIMTASCVCAMPFSDVDPETDMGKAVEKLWQMGYVNGYDGKNFAPSNNLTRAEFVKIVNNVFFYNVAGENVFTDVKKDDWFYNDVLVASQAGYIKGMGDGRFCPEENVTREQICVILDNILGLAELPFAEDITDEVSEWAEASVKKAIAFGYAKLEEGAKFRATCG